jgi:soluble lytic murein transglycosylase-like protein
MSRTVRLAAAALMAVLLAPAGARAEIVYLKSGRTYIVRAHRLDGDQIVLSLRGGGELTCSRDLVASIEPDEVPQFDPEPSPLPVVAPAALEGVPFAELITREATRQGVDPHLVSAVIRVESAYKPRARSRKGAKGLMQLMPSTVRQYGVKDPFDPGANIEAGVRHLKSLLERFELSLALAAYNAGEGAVQRFRGIPPYRETRDYVRKILALVKR